MNRIRNNWYHRIGIMLAMVVLIASAIVPMAGCSTETEEIDLGTAVWNYDYMSNLITQYALEDKGYTVNLKEITEMGIMFTAIDQGSVDLYAQVWLPNFHKSYLDAATNIVHGGSIFGEPCPYVWTIPTWVSEEYGITSIEDLKGKGDIFNGVITGLEEGTGGTTVSREAVIEYGMQDEYEYVASSISAMVAELEAAMLIKKPIIVLLWRPHPIMDRLDLTFLEDPKDVFGLDTPQWAMNTTFHDENPKIVAFMNNLLIPISDMETMMARNDAGETEADLAREWFENNKATVDSWWK
jgi:glycine betaine/proline transport system substrate-binding protein